MVAHSSMAMSRTGCFPRGTQQLLVGAQPRVDSFSLTSLVLGIIELLYLTYYDMMLYLTYYDMIFDAHLYLYFVLLLNLLFLSLSDNTQDIFMPTAKHFWNRQCWQDRL